MRRRDFTTGLVLASAIRIARAQELPKQHRIAVVNSAGPLADISDTGPRVWRVFFEELRRLGDVEGQNLTVERYSGEGRPERYADLAREVVNRNPDVIVAITNTIALAVRAVTDTIPIVWIGVEPIRVGFATSLARPGGNITGVTTDTGREILGKHLQILKDVVPSASKVAYLNTHTATYGQRIQQPFQEASQQLKISVFEVLVQESTPSEFHRVFAEMAQNRPDAIVVSAIGDIWPYRHLIVELIEKSRLPTIYPYRDYVEVGGLMAYESEPDDLWRRMADDVHEVLNGAKPGDIPIYQPSRFQLTLKAAQALGLTIPPSLLARADEVIE